MRRPGIWRRICLLPGALLLTQPTAAQDQPAARSADDIIVKGRPEPRRRDVDRQARAITPRIDVHSEPLARFQDPICPGILGLPRGFAEAMVDRIRFDARRLRIDVAREDGCRPNIVIAFVRNGQREIEAIRNKPGSLLAGLTTAEVRELAADAGPVHAWVNSLVRSRDGDPLRGSAEAGQIPTVTVPAATSHIFLATRLDIVSAVVLIDITAVDGMSVMQLADYAVMRSLARTRSVDSDAAAETILSLFDPGGARPAELTAFDLAYLRSVYGSLPNLPALTKLGGVAREMRREVAEQDASPQR